MATAAYGWRMAALVWLLSGACCLTRRRPGKLAVAAAVSAAAALGAIRGAPPPAVTTPAWVTVAEGARGRVLELPASTGQSQSFQLAVSAIAVDDEWQPASGTLCVSGFPLPSVGVGDAVRLLGEGSPAADQSQAVRSYLASQGCGATFYTRFIDIEQRGTGWRRALADVRGRLGDTLRHAAPGDSGALLSGLVTGDDTRLTDRRKLAFRYTGTTHITAVSGSNVALVVSILATLGIAGGWRRRFAWQLVVVLAIWFYALLVGGEPPVVRAALMASAAIVAVRVGRRPDFITLIALAAMVMVLIEPAQIWSLSFQLSFAASLGIVLVLGGGINDGQLAGASALLRASAAAQIATLPVLWLVFGQLSLTTLPANVLIAPLVTLAFPLAALAGMAGLLWPPLATLLVLPARLCAEGIFMVVDRLGDSSSVMATVGASSPLIALIITAVSALGMLLLSADAQAGLRRALQRIAWRTD